MRPDLDIRRPTFADRDAFADWIAEWRTDPYDAYRWVFARAWTDFDWYVAACERMRIAGEPPELTVAVDVYWAFAGGVLVGELYLFDQPMAGDNHIGYKVRPSFRRHGVATALLHYGLDRLAERGVVQARLTCRVTNVASAAVIERAGGKRLGDKVSGDGNLLRRYTVPIHARRLATEISS